MASETQLLRAPRHDRKRPSVRKPKYHSHLLEVSIMNAVEEGKEEKRTRRTFASTGASWYSAADSFGSSVKKTEKKKNVTHCFQWRGWWCCAPHSSLGLKAWPCWWLQSRLRCWRNAPDRCSGLSSTCGFQTENRIHDLGLNDNQGHVNRGRK